MEKVTFGQSLVGGEGMIRGAEESQEEGTA